MAFQMDYLDGRGVSYENSYWRFLSITISPGDSVVSINFYGYKDHAARLAGMQTIGSKSYSVRAEEYDLWFHSSVLSAEDINPVRNSYEYAFQKLDLMDVDGETPISFFDGAVEV